MTAQPATQPILELKNITSAYGRIKAIREVSLKVYPGEVVSIIGANGAGKSTTLMSICGVIKPEEGEVWYDGVRIDGLAADLLPERGLCQVPEGRRIFPRLTVEENLDMGAFFRKDAAAIEHDKNRVFQLFPILLERRKQHGGTLSGGEQQMVAVGRGLMTKPSLFMLDEPSLGLAPLIVKMIFEIVREINRKGTTVLLVEQNAHAALEVADFGYVLETGAISFSGTGSELLADDRVRQAYLGEN